MQGCIRNEKFWKDNTEFKNYLLMNLNLFKFKNFQIEFDKQ